MTGCGGGLRKSVSARFYQKPREYFTVADNNHHFVVVVEDNNLVEAVDNKVVVVVESYQVEERITLVVEDVEDMTSFEINKREKKRISLPPSRQLVFGRERGIM